MKIYGKNSVFERLRSNPSTIRRIYIQEGFDAAAYVYKKAKLRGIPVVVVPKSKIFKLSRNTNAQGILVEADDFAYVPYADLLENALEKRISLLFLDNLNDPQNLGSILRSAGSLGGFGIVLPTHDSVSVTESALRVASGGDNYVPVAMVANLNNAIRNAKQKGFTVYGAVVGEGESLKDISLSFPLGLVIGSEHKGVRDIVKKELDHSITIPMHIHTMSLNVSQATTILCYEINRQKNIRKKSG